jgi:hypothetical protein
MGYRIHEVPIAYDPRDLSEGKKIRAWHGIEAVWVMLKYRLMPEALLFQTRLQQAPRTTMATTTVGEPASPNSHRPVAIA